MATIQKRPSGRWQVTVRRKGAPSQTKTFRTKAQAQNWARALEDTLLTGAKPTLTVAEAVDRYAREVTAQKKGAAQELYRLRVLREVFGAQDLARVTPEAVVAWVQTRLAGVHSDTVRRDLAPFSNLIEWARVIWGYEVGANPVRVALSSLERTHMLRRKVSRERRLRPGEYRRLLKASAPRLRFVIRLAVETGLRRGEIVRLRPSDLSERGLLVSDDKAGKTSTIPVTGKARRLIAGMPATGVGVRADSITQAFERACRRAGVEGLRFHDLRREATSRLFARGLQVHEVAMITRHSDWRTLKIYTQPTVEEIEARLGQPHL